MGGWLSEWVGALGVWKTLTARNESKRGGAISWRFPGAGIVERGHTCDCLCAVIYTSVSHQNSTVSHFSSPKQQAQSVSLKKDTRTKCIFTRA